MAMLFCRGCGQQIHDSAIACPHCGAPQGEKKSMSAEAPLPDGIKGWSWGAFLFNWIWGIFNGVWISLLVLIPVVGAIFIFVLGFKGREWAWRKKQWRSVEHFQEVQRKWSVWAVGLTLTFLAIGILGAIGASYMESRSLSERTAQSIQQQQAEAELAEKNKAEAQLAIEAQQVAEEAKRVAAAKQAKDDEERIEQAAGTTSANGQANIGESSTVGPSNLTPDYLEAARTCSSHSQCVQIMLVGALPRRADVVQNAATRLAASEKPIQGDRKVARELNKQGLERFGSQDYEGAMKILQQAAMADPADVEIASNLGLISVKANKPHEAQAELIRALGLDPRRSAAWVPYAQSALALNNFDAGHRALLLAYEFSANKQKTLEYYRGKTEDSSLPLPERDLFLKTLTRVESGY